jgi:hypothetical protein
MVGQSLVWTVESHANANAECGMVDISFAGASPGTVNDYLPPIELLEDIEPQNFTSLSCPALNIVIHVVGSRGRHGFPTVSLHVANCPH